MGLSAVPGHVPEGIVWAQIAERYKTRFVNEVLAIVHHDHGGGAQRLSSCRDIIRNAPGSLLLAESAFKQQWRYFRDDPGYFFHCAINFTRFSLHTDRLSIRRPARLPGSLLLIAMIPIGFAAYVFDLWRERHL